MKQILAVFEKCTGQQLSLSKCSLLMNDSRDIAVCNQVRDVLGVQRVDFEAKHLGLPTPHGRLKRGAFQPLEEQFQKRMTVWKEKDLSAAGKEIQIKSVAQALPNYVMSVFKLPATLCEDLMRHIRGYWWGFKNGRREVQWIPWEKMIMPKGFGGMGFRDLRLVNQALLTKKGLEIGSLPG